MTVRSTLVGLGYKAAALGMRIPQSKNVADFNQWGHLIDLTRRLGINIFLDVGANRGFFSKHLRMAGYAGHLFSFEPIAEDCDRIRALADGDPKWTVCDYALGDERDSKEFNVNLTDGQSVLSSFLPIKGESDNIRRVPVQVHRLDDVLPKLIEGIKSPRIFLKMDTQGFDGRVINGASGCLDLILGIQSEISVVSIYDDIPHYTESLAHYERLGFSLVDLFAVTRMPDGRVREYDCVMVRD
jgi:FkbM family methyltransferase